MQICVQGRRFPYKMMGCWHNISEKSDRKMHIKSEMNQKEKEKYRILTHTYRIQKNCTEEFIYRATMETDREQTYGHGEWGGEGEMHGKSNMETHITTCKMNSQREFAVWLRKLKQELCINLEEWDGTGDGREFQKGGDICIPMADSC